MKRSFVLLGEATTLSAAGLTGGGDSRMCTMVMGHC
jgi:hypothetical protein